MNKRIRELMNKWIVECIDEWIWMNKWSMNDLINGRIDGWIEWMCTCWMSILIVDVSKCTIVNNNNISRLPSSNRHEHDSSNRF